MAPTQNYNDEDPQDEAFRQASAEIFRLEAVRRQTIDTVPIPVRRDDSDEEDWTPSPLYDRCLRTEHEEGVQLWTNFSPQEFDQLWRAVDPFLAANWSVGRGRKTTCSPKDLLFLTLSALKHCGSWDTVASAFNFSPSTFQKMIKKFISVLEPHLYKGLVKDLEKRWTMKDLHLSGNMFENYPYARYATDVTFHHTNKPTGNHNKAITYFSGKHQLYGYKVEVSVLPNGLALNCTVHAPGSKADITMYRENEAFHVGALRKTAEETDLRDDGPLQEECPDQWAVLVGKGYQGLVPEFRTIHPTRKPQGDDLTYDQKITNDGITADRVVVKNYFGRLKTLWAVCSDKWTWDEASYDQFFRCCLAFTNMHIRLNPLRKEDGEAYQKYVKRLIAIGEEIEANKKRKRSEYHANRQARLSLIAIGEEIEETRKRKRSEYGANRQAQLSIAARRNTAGNRTSLDSGFSEIFGP